MNERIIENGCFSLGTCKPNYSNPNEIDASVNI